MFLLKIIAKIIATRIKNKTANIAPSIINSDQTGNVKNKCFGENTRIFIQA